MTTKLHSRNLPRLNLAERRLLTKTLLPQIYSERALVKQWTPENGPSSTDAAATYFKYIARYEVLLEILEVANCGSIGGFDNGQPDKCNNPNLESRFKWLAARAKREFGFVVKTDPSSFSETMSESFNEIDRFWDRVDKEEA